MIQLELTGGRAVLCDTCARAWYRDIDHPHQTDTELRMSAMYRGWRVHDIHDRCPNCTRKQPTK